MNDEWTEMEREWKQPRELATACPRDVQLSGSGKFMAVLAGIFLVGAFGAAYALQTGRTRQVLKREAWRETGVEAEGVVTRHWRTGGKEDTPKIAYEFEHDGRTEKGDAAAPLRIWRTLQVGSQIRVRYVPSNPQINHPADWQWDVMPAFVPGMSGGFLMVMGLLFVSLIRRDSRLLADGKAAPARVTGYRHDKGGKRLRYEFRSSDGVTRKGGGGTMRKPPAIGSIITILYDRDNPRRNHPYPLEMVRPAR